MKSDAVASLVEQVDVNRLRVHVSRLAVGERHSRFNPALHSETVDYITTAFEEYGLRTRRHSFDRRGREGVNLLASRPESSKPETRPLLVSAHYDTVRGSPGADDNASGIAVLLECARVLSTARLSTAVEFAAFDMEEKQPEGGALAGSRTFVKATGGRGSYEALYNLEMVGYTSGPGTQGHPPGFRFILPGAYKWGRQRRFLGDFVAIVGRGPGVDLGRRFREAARRWVPDLEVLPLEFKHPIPLMTDIFRSDHAPFWAAGVPAVMITDTANFRNPHYHRPSDTPDTLDYDFMGNVARTLVATMAQHAGLA